MTRWMMEVVFWTICLLGYLGAMMLLAVWIG